MHDSEDVRMAALQTLGYICDEISGDDLSEQLKNQVMVALTNNISSDASKTKTCNLAIKAFFSALPFAQNNFKVEEQRDFIMN